MATIRDVANLAGVSIATVSRVLNCKPNTSQAATEAVNAAIQELNYIPLKKKSSHKKRHLDSPLGVLVADVSNPFYGLIVKAVDKVARSSGRSLLITNGYHDLNDEKEAIELLINHGCESIVIHSKALSDETLKRYASRVPGLVFINRYIPGLDQRCIYLDNVNGSVSAIQYLMNRGHVNIGYLGSDHAIDDAKERIKGFRLALEANGVACSEDNIILAEPDDEGGAEAMSNLLAKNKPITAVATYNDFMASGAISVLRENGIRVPEDISIIGFDDSHIASHVQPKLTTVRYPVQIMAEQAASLSLELVRDEQLLSDTSKVYIPTLVPRNSVIGLDK